MAKRTQVVVFRIIAAIATIASLMSGSMAVVAAKPATAPVRAPSANSCIKFEGSEIGQNQTVTIDGVTVSITSFGAKPGENNEYISFEYSVEGGSATFAVKSGTETETFDASDGDSGTFAVSVTSNNSGTLAISNIQICVTPAATATPETPTTTATTATPETPTTTATTATATTTATTATATTTATTATATTTATTATPVTPTTTTTTTPGTCPGGADGYPECNPQIDAEVNIGVECASRNADGTYTVRGVISVLNQAEHEQDIRITQATAKLLAGNSPLNVDLSAIETAFEGKVILQDKALDYNYAVTFAFDPNAKYALDFSIIFESVQGRGTARNPREDREEFVVKAKDVCAVTPTPTTSTPTATATTATATTTATTATATTTATTATATTTATTATATTTATTATPVTPTATTATATTSTPATATATTSTPATATATTATETATSTTAVSTTTPASGGGNAGGGTSGGAPAAPAAAAPAGAAPAAVPAVAAPAVAAPAVAGPSRNVAVAGVTDEDAAEEAATVARPRAVLSATGATDATTWLLLSFAMMLVALGSGVRASQLKRD